MNRDDGIFDDASHAARALLGGRPLDITTEAVFARLEQDLTIPVNMKRAARRTFEAMQIGLAVEAVKSSGPGPRRANLFRLARVIRLQVADRQPGWFRFLVRLGSQRAESMFQLSFDRRPRSQVAQPKAVLSRNTSISRSLNAMMVAGTILKRIEVAKAHGRQLTVRGAIEAAINAGDIKTDEEAAMKTWQHFRKDCRHLTDGDETYRLEIYNGPIEKYKGHWIAVADSGLSLSRLPAAEGGRPKT